MAEEFAQISDIVEKIVDTVNTAGEQAASDAPAETAEAAAQAPEAAQAAGEKSLSEIADEVITGLWGNGEEREAALTAAGYDYAAVQEEVNRQLAE